MRIDWNTVRTPYLQWSVAVCGTLRNLQYLHLCSHSKGSEFTSKENGICQHEICWKKTKKNHALDQFAYCASQCSEQSNLQTPPETEAAAVSALGAQTMRTTIRLQLRIPLIKNVHPFCKTKSTQNNVQSCKKYKIQICANVFCFNWSYGPPFV